MYLGKGKIPECAANNCCIRISRIFKEIFTSGKDAISCSAHPLSENGFEV